MGKEIERKFLLKNESWRAEDFTKIEIQQGYLNSDPRRVVRIRLKNRIGIITIKGKMEGITRIEYEYEIPYKDGVELLKLCEAPIIAKDRYLVLHHGKTWEIDIFKKENAGLKVAEIELNSEEEAFELPDWIGAEVTQDKRYLNSNLITHPYTNW